MEGEVNAKDKDNGKSVIEGKLSVISERLFLLHGSRDEWKMKVTEKDMEQFTVVGKLNKSGNTSSSSLMFNVT